MPRDAAELYSRKLQYQRRCRLPDVTDRWHTSRLKIEPGDLPGQFCAGLHARLRCHRHRFLGVGAAAFGIVGTHQPIRRKPQCNLPKFNSSHRKQPANCSPHASSLRNTRRNSALTSVFKTLPQSWQACPATTQRRVAHCCWRWSMAKSQVAVPCGRSTPPTIPVPAR